MELGYHHDAYDCLQKSWDIYRTLPGRRNKAILMNNFGDVARYRFQLNAALRSYREALSEFSASHDRFNESNALNNIGLTLSDMEKYNEALIHHKMAMSIAEEIESTGEKIRAQLGIALARHIHERDQGPRDREDLLASGLRDVQGDGHRPRRSRRSASDWR